MTNWPVHVTWNGPIVMIGFGSIGRGTLPLILRHIACDKAKITVIDPSASWSHLVEKEGVAFLKQEHHEAKLQSYFNAAAHRRPRAGPDREPYR